MTGLSARVSVRFSAAGLLLVFGVSPGVPVGVELALPARAFLDDDRGVILELMKALTGVVEGESEAIALCCRADSVFAPRRSPGDTVVVAEVANRGVNGGRGGL